MSVRKPAFASGMLFGAAVAQLALHEYIGCVLLLGGSVLMMLASLDRGR